MNVTITKSNFLNSHFWVIIVQISNINVYTSKLLEIIKSHKQTKKQNGILALCQHEGIMLTFFLGIFGSCSVGIIIASHLNIYTFCVELISFYNEMTIEPNIRTLVLLNLLNSLRKNDKMLGKPHISSLFPNSFNEFNKT